MTNTGAQPIATAPSNPGRQSWDQPRILLYVASVHRRGWYFGRWEPDAYSQKRRPFWLIQELGITESRNNQPTLWMPAPEDPA